MFTHSGQEYETQFCIKVFITLFDVQITYKCSKNNVSDWQVLRFNDTRNY